MVGILPFDPSRIEPVRAGKRHPGGAGRSFSRRRRNHPVALAALRARSAGRSFGSGSGRSKRPGRSRLRSTGSCPRDPLYPRRPRGHQALGRHQPKWPSTVPSHQRCSGSHGSGRSRPESRSGSLFRDRRGSGRRGQGRTRPVRPNRVRPLRKPGTPPAGPRSIRSREASGRARRVRKHRCDSHRPMHRRRAGPPRNCRRRRIGPRCIPSNRRPHCRRHRSRSAQHHWSHRRRPPDHSCRTR